MFSTLGLFLAVPCPRKNSCTFCPFSHAHDTTPPIPLIATPDPAPAPSKKRPFELTASSSSSEPPPQRIRTASAPKPVRVPAQISQSSSGAPVLRVNAVQSQVALPVRQALLKSIYDHFVVLYENLLPSNPSLASEHALRQEEQVYKNSTKLTYRNAVINSIASLKKRPIPTSISHPSVGTEEDITARAEARKKLDTLRLTRTILAHLFMTTDVMQQWNYITEIPNGDGGSKPHAVGQIVKCERCGQPYMVANHPTDDECTYHWGRPFSKTINGEKLRIYSCCSKTTSEDGCSRGSHVFYESDPINLHLRQPFSLTRPPKSCDGDNSADTAFDVVALDCEMIYTTGGMRVARVSVVDGAGAEVFDELVRMDDGVEVIDYNTRFSGITKEEHRKASLTLSSIRQSLDVFINSETIIIGHALENDLKTLRMIHHQCIDTAILFPHRAGPPYRRSLRDLAKEHLGISIQTGGGSTGHSSVEDSVATLDLVRWHILNKPNKKTTTQDS
ncbi:ribonuclease H-like protein [Boletus reticuloceps]|uniref:Ribonuclease H-like protein n=1 Tax=Boletus reticuloceps TaxID=495285 RepID=A0A8I2YW06_9AGAM|nr:ribonuclease H-like protein [Boletus reticuloceps]